MFIFSLVLTAQIEITQMFIMKEWINKLKPQNRLLSKSMILILDTRNYMEESTECQAGNKSLIPTPLPQQNLH
jgi:hypothetical protein